MSISLPKILHTERLILEKLKSEDAEQIFYAYASKPEATKFVSWPTHKSVDDTRLFLRHAANGWSKHSDFSFAIWLNTSHQLIGSFGVINDFGKIQFGYIISPSQWGRGYATEVCMHMMTMLKEQPGVFRINTFVDKDNVASIKVLLKSGLKEEAELKKWFRFVNQGNQPKDCKLFYLPM